MTFRPMSVCEVHSSAFFIIILIKTSIILPTKVFKTSNSSVHYQEQAKLINLRMGKHDKIFKNMLSRINICTSYFVLQ